MLVEPERSLFNSEEIEAAIVWLRVKGSYCSRSRLGVGFTYSASNESFVVTLFSDNDEDEFVFSPAQFRNWLSNLKESNPFAVYFPGEWRILKT
jgi:hypothetical protein